jgi:hypothetical protein
MREAIKRIVLRLFPELSGGLHLPRYAKVVGVADLAQTGNICDSFRPRFSVDVVALDANGDIDTTLPRFNAIQLPASAAGNERGNFSYPIRGAIVVLNFAYGRPDKPFISLVLPQGLTLPGMDEGDMVQQQNDAVKQVIKAGGSINRSTDQKIADKATTYMLDAVEEIKTLHRQLTTINEHSILKIKGNWVRRILGAGRLLVGGTLNISALDNLSLTTGSDMNTNVARNKKSSTKGDETTSIGGNEQKNISGARTIIVTGNSGDMIGGNYTQTISGDRAESVTGASGETVGGNKTTTVTGTMNSTSTGPATMASSASASISAPAIGIGNGTINLMVELKNMCSSIIAIANALQVHTHKYYPGPGDLTDTSAPDNASTYATESGHASTAKANITSITH